MCFLLLIILWMASPFCHIIASHPARTLTSQNSFEFRVTTCWSSCWVMLVLFVCYFYDVMWSLFLVFYDVIWSSCWCIYCGCFLRFVLLLWVDVVLYCILQWFNLFFHICSLADVVSIPIEFRPWLFLHLLVTLFNSMCVHFWANRGGFQCGTPLLAGRTLSPPKM